MAKNEYRALQGIDYPPNKRVEIGDIVSDLPKESITWLLVSGAIEEVSASKSNTESVSPKSPAKTEVILEDVSAEEVADAL